MFLWSVVHFGRPNVRDRRPRGICNPRLVYSYPVTFDHACWCDGFGPRGVPGAPTEIQAVAPSCQETLNLMESQVYCSRKADMQLQRRRQCMQINGLTNTRRLGLRHGNGRGGRWLLLSLVATVMFHACATSRGSSQQPAPTDAQSDSHIPAQSDSQIPAQSDGHIYVTAGGLGETCYQDLGQLTVSEPFAQSVVEAADSEAQRLRALAREKYSSRVDAIINVRQQQNDAGTAVEITGDAVHVQNHQTLACAARGMPGVVDSAAAAANGGIIGTVIGGLSQSGGSVYGAEAGGAMGASAAGGMEIAKHLQQQQMEEASIGDRLQQQQTEISQLYQQLAKLIGQQCNNEELSEQECEQRVAAVQQEITDANGTAPAPASSTKSGAPANAGATTEFALLNRIQQQQEVIDQLQDRIAQIKQSTDNQ
jgi:hypothetical protein